MKLHVIALVLIAAAPAIAQWQPAGAPLLTRWAADVSPDNPWPEYPRPTLQRDDWLNLNGLWDYAILDADAQPNTRPESWDGQILVPYPIESALSGVGRSLTPDQTLVYHTTFEIPDEWNAARVILHVEAADWQSRVEINATEVGTHSGGYDRASYDITDALNDQGTQTIDIVIKDPTDASTQPRGKQVRQPNGIWYTPTSGVWQTVWLEPLPDTSVEHVDFKNDIESGDITATIQATRGQSEPATVAVSDNGVTIAEATGRCGEPIHLHVPNHKLWSPDDPALYDVEISLASADHVRTYTAFREISVRPDERGVTRIHLNGQPIFLLGTLDQGFWPDGLYTPPTDDAMAYDLEVTKRLGFNTVRKHVKVEPERWYTHCDNLGLLVLQDMPSGDAYVSPGEGEIERTPASAAQYEKELTSLINQKRSHPCIVMWVPFNEGWGQYDTARIVEKVKLLDPTRLVDPASGWNDFPVGDVHDIHVYPGPGSPEPEASRAAFLGEFGGLGLPLEGHTWQEKDNWGYRSYKSAKDLTDAYVTLMHDMRWLIADPGLSGAIYTQTTDVEIEVNGLMSYDREVLKVDEPRVKEAHAALAKPAPTLHTLVDDSRADAAEWRYTTAKPPDDWTHPDFDDSNWQTGPAGFGRDNTPGAVVRTPWTTDDIWIRRTVTIPAMPLHDPHLRIHHDEDAQVYINATLAASLDGYTTGYVFRPISREARAELLPGKAVIAVHCHQTGGGQYIDLGIVDLAP